jgi:hypothetical protein
MDTSAENSSRAESAALGGGIFHLLLSGVISALSFHSPETLALQILAAQTGLGFFVCAAAFIHLRLRRLRAVEQIDREQVEPARRAQGLASLFSADEISPAERNWRQFNKYLVPVISVFIALLALAPLARLLAAGKISQILFADLPLKLSAAVGILPLLAAFMLFMLDAYAANLAKVPAWRHLRAAAGSALLAALWLALFGVEALLGFKISFYPLRAVALLIAIGGGLQAIEILLAALFEHYRPRVAGIAPRAPYDSRLAGLFADPEGIDPHAVANARLSIRFPRVRHLVFPFRRKITRATGLADVADVLADVARGGRRTGLRGGD